jgi:hypothetical protein
MKAACCVLALAVVAALSIPSAAAWPDGPSDDDCLACHADASLTSSAGKSVAVDAAKAQASVHGAVGLACVDCHADLRGTVDFPHAATLRSVDCSGCHERAARALAGSVHAPAATAKDGLTVACKDCHGSHDIRPSSDFESKTFPLNLPETCLSCHGERVQTPRGSGFVRLYEKSAHFRALESSGLTISANCATCHGAHDILAVGNTDSSVSRKNIVTTCGQCHVGIRRDYLEGVHGKDYIKGIKDVPVCTDCHREHDILSPEDTESSVYTTKVAQVCSRCHDDVALSRRYGFLPDRMRTYAQSYHGTASKFGEIRVANCASCHGFHDIRDPSDPQSSVYPANLPATCGRCHPGATRHFAEGKIHLVAAEADSVKDRTPHIVKTAYIIMISAIITVFLLFIGADLLHRAIRGKNHD